MHLTGIYDFKADKFPLGYDRSKKHNVDWVLYMQHAQGVKETTCGVALSVFLGGKD